jgi:hypothetical protein
MKGQARGLHSLVCKLIHRGPDVTVQTAKDAKSAEDAKPGQ